jgi:inosine/xanthosine triphosphatase
VSSPERESVSPHGASHALHRLRSVRVGSTNAPKLEGVSEAIRAYAPGARIDGVAVESGVPGQPLGFEEIVAGARRRATEAARGGACDLAVGYEDGLVQVPVGPGTTSPRWFNIGCAVVLCGPDEGVGFSSGFAYPPGCAERAAATREPIGDLFDALWRRCGGEPAPLPSARSVGNVGKLTGGVLTRAEYTRHAVLCALAPLLHPALHRGEVSA